MTAPVDIVAAPEPFQMELQARYDALARDLTAANEAVQAKADAAIARAANATETSAKLQGEYSELSVEHAMLIIADSKKAAQIQQLQTDLADALAKLAKVPPIYQNIPGRCIAVLPRKGATCPNCGWQFQGPRIQDHEPHICAAT